MKIFHIACLSVASLALLRSASGQGFVNLDFEGSYATSFANVSIPGWSLGGSLLYDTVSLGGAAVILEDQNAQSSISPVGFPLIPLQGGYSVLVDYQSAYIGQTGTIPNTAQSLTFFAIQSGLQVTFNGQNIPFSAIGNGVNTENGANYTIYGANIASYAGETGQLLFTTPGYGAALLDNIQFSPSSVPEPSVFGLLAFSCLLIRLRILN